MTAPWDTVAARGTDPALLADVVAALLADEPGTRRRVADAVDAGRAPDRAVRTAVPGRLVHDPAVERAGRTWLDAGVRVALLGDPVCPPRVAAVPDPPPLLALRGDLAPLTSRPVVAIVGSRAATAYGRSVAAWLSEAAAASGAHVVSGGAVGIDGAAHGAAVDEPGRTTVVLGCGHDVPYPRPHAATGGLFQRVLAAGGAVVSECLPGTRPRAHRVRARNRLVAGTADVVVVVEGGARSGSLITATAASDRGVTVMAVPGDVRAPGSAAPHRLLTEGAAPCTSPDDLLDALGVAAARTPDQPGGTAAAAVPSVLPEPVRAVLADAWPRSIPVEELARQAAVPTGALLAALTRARVVGEVAVGPDGAVLRRSPSVAASAR